MTPDAPATIEAPAIEAPAIEAPAPAATPIDPAMFLNQQIATMVSQGWGVESVTPTQAVMVKGKRCNHVLHLLLTVFTVGVWLPVWLVLGLAMGEKRKVVQALPAV